MAGLLTHVCTAAVFVIFAAFLLSSTDAAVRSRQRPTRISRQAGSVGGILRQNLDKINPPPGKEFDPERVSNSQAGNKLAEHFKPNLEEKDPGLFFGKNPTNLPGEEVGDSSYRWHTIIDWTVNNEVALQYMGQLEIFLPAYEWTLGYYYWLRPDGHLQEVFYNSRPDYGFRNEVFVIDDYLPQNWYSNKVDYTLWSPGKSDNAVATSNSAGSGDNRLSTGNKRQGRRSIRRASTNFAKN